MLVHPKTFNDLFDEYCDVMKHTMSEKTLYTKIGYYKKHFRSKYGNLDFIDFRYKDAQSFVNELIEKGLKPKTIKNIVDIFKVLYRYAIRNEYTTKNPFSDVIIPKFDNRIEFKLTDEEIKRFIKAVLTFPYPQQRGIFITLLHGRRLNEVLSLTWEDIDFENNLYYIKAPINKARKNMAYQMTDILKEVFLTQENIKYLNCPTSKYVFPSPVTCKKIKDIRKSFKKLLKLARINKPMRIHDIRHLIATYSINTLGLSIEEVSYTLGHTSIEVTQRYITPRAEISRKVINKIFQSVVGGRVWEI